MTTFDNQPSKVLLVEDVELLLNLEKSFLSRDGNEVHTATNGLDAIKLAGELKPDLVVLDLNLPEISGFDVLKWIRSRDDLQQTRVIILSVSGRPDDAKKCREIGCDEYLTKPVTKKLLLDTIGRVFGVTARSEERIPIEIDVYGYRSGERFYGRSRDISSGGIYMVCDRKFLPGSFVKLFFSLPGDEEIIQAGSQVIRVDELSPGGREPSFGLAFNFVELESSRRDQIQSLSEKTEQ